MAHKMLIGFKVTKTHFQMYPPAPQIKSSLNLHQTHWVEIQGCTDS